MVVVLTRRFLAWLGWSAVGVGLWYVPLCVVPAVFYGRRQNLPRLDRVLLAPIRHAYAEVRSPDDWSLITAALVLLWGTSVAVSSTAWRRGLIVILAFLYVFQGFLHLV